MHQDVPIQRHTGFTVWLWHSIASMTFALFCTRVMENAASPNLAEA